MDADAKNQQLGDIEKGTEANDSEETKMAPVPTDSSVPEVPAGDTADDMATALAASGVCFRQDSGEHHSSVCFENLFDKNRAGGSDASNPTDTDAKAQITTEIAGGENRPGTHRSETDDGEGVPLGATTVPRYSNKGSDPSLPKSGKSKRREERAISVNKIIGGIIAIVIFIVLGVLAFRAGAKGGAGAGDTAAAGMFGTRTTAFALATYIYFGAERQE